MNLLFLSRWFPYPPDNGSKIRIFNVLKQLSKDHHITLLAFHESVDAISVESLAVLGTYCERIRAIPYRLYRPTSARSVIGLFAPRPRFLIDTDCAEMREAVRREGAARTFGLVVATELDMIPYALSAGLGPAIVDDLEIGTHHDRMLAPRPLVSRGRAALTWLKLRGYLRKVLPRLAACTVVSQHEQVAIQQIAVGYDRVSIIPNAVDLADYAGSYGAPVPETMLFSGALSFYPNFDALRYFLAEVYPLIQRTHPNVTLKVTGSTANVDLTSLPHSPGVEYTGYLTDVRPTVAQSWVSVVPLRIGSGTRLKIIESMALGTPVVSTPKGAEGLVVNDGKHILLAPDAPAFARQVVDVLESPIVRGRLTDAGRALVGSRYDWNVVGRDLRDLVDRVVA